MAKHNALKDGYLISNPMLLMLIGILSVGILLDGKLYNKPTVTQAIYPIAGAELIELHHSDQLILRFSKKNAQWMQTHPFEAPAKTQRIEVLLDTNHFSNRQYPESQISDSEVFKDSLTLTIDGAEYEFGAVEPVSKLRYVRANSKVYLQPDSVIPLLSAANNAFVDLKITNKIDQVVIGDSVLEQPDAWSNLHAIDIVEGPTRPGLDVSLKQKQQTLNFTASHADSGYVLSAENGFHYLLDTTVAESIGLAELLDTK